MSTVLLSGGIDSSTVLFDLAHGGDDDILPVAIDYGQRHKREIESARQVVTAAQAQFPVRDLVVIRAAETVRGGALTEGRPAPKGAYTQEYVERMVLPHRNASFLLIAVGLAYREKMPRVYYGAHSGDHAIYPDCRWEFVEAFNQMLDTSLPGKTPTVVAPFIHWSKSEIIDRAAELRVPLGLTWSCYRGGERHCGECGTCIERRESFGAADVPDPTSYEAR